MKKININIVIILIIIIIIISIVVVSKLNYLLSNQNIIQGYFKAEENFDPFSTQDSVDYCKYYYTNNYDSIFSNRYAKVSDKNIKEIKEYIDKFKEWMKADNRLNDFDFDEGTIDEKDFYLLYDKSNYENKIEYKKYEYFTVHFYDSNSHILYYMHVNI